MSQLQVSLLILGAVVIAGVVAYNWLQERSHRKRTEQAFEQPPADVLFDRIDPGASIGAATPPPRVETEFRRDHDGINDSDPEPQPVRPAPEATRAAPRATGDEPTVDCDVVLAAAQPFDEAALRHIVEALVAVVRPIRLAGFDDRSNQWVGLDETAPDRFHQLRVGMLIADRRAIASRAELEAFVAAVQGAADSIGATCHLPDIDATEARARELDAFCGDVDIAIGLSVVARTGQQFQGTTIRALAESSGLQLKADGQFHFEDADGLPQFTLDNQDAEPFFPDSIRNLSTTGITFLLDVPRASGALTSFDRMVQITKKFATTLDGIIVDDNRQPLNDKGLDAIRRHLAGVYVAMDNAGIPAGSPLAMRLFS
jgi:FtsZ-interacting cell division protein ZipA